MAEVKKKKRNIYITCPYCGTRLNSVNKRICPSCGKTIPSTGDELEYEPTATKLSNKGLALILAIAVIFFIGSIIFFQQQRRFHIKLGCEANDQVFVEKTESCRDKTISERFEEKCLAGTSVNGKWFSCADLKQANLENAYLNNSLIMHGEQLYEKGTDAEISAGKNVGDYCLEASDTWYHYGEKRCVILHYTYLACSNGYCFLNEKQNYNSGFVAFFGKYGMYSWDSFRATYYGNGPILVCGTIVSYNGHPEIKITEPMYAICERILGIV